MSNPLYPEVMPVDDTQGIYLQMARIEDAPEFHKALAGNEWHLANLGSVKIEDLTVEKLRATYSDPDDDDFVRYRGMKKGRIIGNVSLHGFDPSSGSVKLGGWVSHEYEGSGYATAAALQLVRYTFENVAGIEVIRGEVDPENPRSEQLAMQLGAQLTDEVVMEKKADGRIRPQRVWEIQKS